MTSFIVEYLKGASLGWPLSKTRGHPREAPFRYSTIDDAIDVHLQLVTDVAVYFASATSIL
jgi:hypothetical protein